MDVPHSIYPFSYWRISWLPPSLCNYEQGCYTSSILWLNNIPLYFIIYTIIILFILSLSDEHLDCFHLLATVNNAARNIPIHVFVWTPIFNSSGYLPKSGIAGSCGNSMFSHFEELPNYFPKWLHHFTFAPTVHEGSNFSTSSPTLVIVWLFDFSHPSGCEVVSPSGFVLHFCDDWCCRASFHVPIGHLYFFHGQMSIQVLCLL